jgi:aminoglycoside 6-adenylyltransferase
MIASHDPEEVIPRLVQWGERKDSVRAMLLTSTRAIAGAPVDIFSDYDVVLVVVDIRPFFSDRHWLTDFGEILVEYWDLIVPNDEYDIEESGNVIQYADGLKIDFRLWPVELARKIAQADKLPPGLDAGYTVLLDKDQLTEGMQPPTFRAYIPIRPTNEEFQTAVQDFLSDAPYVAKCLWRDELLPAKQCLDVDMKHVYLRQMLEWRMERDHDWSVPAGNLGKGLKKRLPQQIWDQLEETFAGAGIADNWQALLRTMALYREVAIEVAGDLGYSYPDDLDRRVTAFVLATKDVEHGNGAGH